MNDKTALRRVGAAVATALALTISAAACGGATIPSSLAAQRPAASGQHNQQDVMFTQMMIPHHQQAITMSDHELAVGTDPAVKELATRIKEAQGPEITRMRGWLAIWGTPSTGHRESGDMSGMMSAQSMSGFQAAHGPEADRMFLLMMIQHHQGAVNMARTELRSGVAPQARQLASSIAASQQAQIQQMQRMLSH
jgi:uncharacterized protein (DUF305 family)